MRRVGLFSFIITAFSIIIISGCNSQGTATKVVDALDDKNFDLAHQIFEEELDKTSDLKELNDTVSVEVQSYLDEAYEEMDEDSFYSLITHIEEIGIYDRGFFSSVNHYRELLGIEVEDSDSYTPDQGYEEEEIYEEDYYEEEYYDENEYNEEEVETENPYSATDIDHNCSDFATGEEAQLFYIANGGPEYDPHDLDRDNDGRACDWNP